MTRTVLGEAQYIKQEGRREKISIADKVTVITVAPESLNLIRIEAKEARRGIDAGELEAIAYLNTAEEDLIFDAFVKSPSGLSFRVKREIFILQPIEKIRFLPLVEMTH
ncbi:MAG: hypothetical protein JRE40_07845 [Deltaproteobacteria bacterium]|nr:hypothetical protein [Deltaproteobacteria bacterium]